MTEKTLEDYLEKNRIRQANYYTANKDKINARRREIYAQGKGIVGGIPKKPSNEPAPIPENEKVSSLDYSKLKTLSYNKAVEGLRQINWTSEQSFKNYQTSLKRLFDILQSTDIIKSLKNSKKVIDAIKQTDYSVNTVKMLYQTILFINTKFNLNLSKKVFDAYNSQFEEQKIGSKERTEEKASAETVYNFPDYLNQVKQTFGQDSKMYVLSSLYEEHALRDDYILRIVESKVYATKNNISNYLVYRDTGKMRVVIAEYKTSAKYGVIDEDLSAKLSRLIKTYIKKNNLEVNVDYLFGNKPLTQFVSNNNKKMGISGGITLYRQMKISSINGMKNLSNAERVELARKMKHSPMVQLNYLRNLKTD
jgi:hypothetical protein